MSLEIAEEMIFLLHFYRSYDLITKYIPSVLSKLEFLCSLLVKVGREPTCFFFLQVNHNFFDIILL